MYECEGRGRTRGRASQWTSRQEASAAEPSTRSDCARGQARGGWPADAGPGVGVKDWQDRCGCGTRRARHRHHWPTWVDGERSEEHTSELQSHSFISYAVFCLKKKK